MIGHDYITLSSKKYATQKEFWLEKLNDIENIDNFLENDYFDTNNVNKKIETLYFDLDGILAKKILSLSGDSELNLFTILLSALACMLYKYKETQKIFIPIPVCTKDNNLNKQLNKEILISYSLTDEMTFREIIVEAKKNIINACENQDYPMEMIIEEMEKQSQMKYGTLFENIFIFKNISSLEVTDQINKDFAVICSRDVDKLKFQLSYNANKYNEERIKRLEKHYCSMLKKLLDNPYVSIGSMEIVDYDERNQLLIDFNNSYINYPQKISITEIFESRVQETPDKIAVIHNTYKLTYEELNTKANQLARFILKNEFSKKPIIGIITERSIDTVIAVLGVLKAGGACLTIDHSFPKERIKYILDNSEVNLVITHVLIKDDMESDINKDDVGNRKIININDENIYMEEGYNLEGIITEDSIAHIIYTSGSTGNPKGVMLKHSNLINILYSLERQYPLLVEDSYLFKTNYTFDASISELYGWFFGKGCLVVLDHVAHKDPRKIIKAILKYGVTHINFVPSMFTTFVNTIFEEGIKSLNRLKYIFVGGEVLSSEIVKKFYSLINGVKVMNLYGPTETTIYATSYQISPDENRDKLPIGKPMDNTLIYILDDKKMLVPVGISGEIYIGGSGVSQGYVNNERLTKERYIDNPYRVGEKMYKSGDIARWNEDGNIDYIGRSDHQIKLRGLRIELGEIENKIVDFYGVSQAVVIVQTDAVKGQYLCGYLVGNADINIFSLKEYLYSQLPVYMVPSYIIQLSQFPYTRTGKIDLLNLPEPTKDINKNNDYIEPVTKLEKEICEIWNEVLGESMIGITDNFFDLGGNSLNVIAILSKILTKYNVDIPMGLFFELKTIDKVCEYINSKDKIIYSSMKPIEKQEYYIASSAQRRIYALNAINKNNINYNMPEVLIIDGEIDKMKVNRIFNQLIIRHEAFRTHFEFRDNELVQIIKNDIEFKVEFMDFEEAKMHKLINSFIRPFDLEKAPLLRVLLVKVEKFKHYLLIDMHHIISDGTSMGVIIDEFIKLYKDEKLKELSIQYKEFSHWQSEFVKSDHFKNQEKFWIDMFSGEIPTLDLPTDFPRGKDRSYEGETLMFELDKEIVSKLKKLAAKNSVTPYVFLLSTYYILLSKYSGQEDIVVAYPIVGRTLPELNDVVGMFVNTVAMRSFIDNKKSFMDFLSEIRNKFLNVYENQDYQFDMLVDKLNVKRNSNRNALFDTMFSLRDTYFSQITLDNCTFRKHNFETKQTKFDLYFNIEDYEDKVLLEMTYRTDLFKKETMKRLNQQYKNIIEEVVQNPYIKIADIEMLSKIDKQLICCDLNSTDCEYPKNSNLMELFEQQVENHSNSIAIEFDDKKLTYRELNAKANQIARQIIEKNISQGSIIGLFCERSLEMIIGIIGTLKAGCAYLPIDINSPRERVKFITEDSNCRLILSNVNISDSGLSYIEVLRLDDELIYSGCSDNLELNISYDDLAYIIYTSGTSGRPKGVLIRHYNVVKTVKDTNYCDISDKDTLLQLSNYAFDASVFDIFSSLLCGAKLVLISSKIILDIDKLAEIIGQKKISMVLIPTALFNLIVEVNVECLKNIRRIYVGGERLKSQYARKAIEVIGAGKLVNLYGPTEGTVISTFYEINTIADCENEIPIGKPVSNTQVYICNKHNQIQPFGVLGEICISGDGIGKGYLNSNELQAVKFVPNTFRENSILYKTGDLGKMMPDGNIIFSERVDNQVKLRGYRIELGEIEENILTYEGIKECVAMVQKDKNSNEHLCAYLSADKDIDIDKLKLNLRNKLPQYMIPDELIIIDQLPFTANGKVDKSLLRNMSKIKSNERNDKSEVLDDIEKQIKNVWIDILGKEDINVFDNFFECGGNSLLAVKVEVELKKYCLKIEVEDIYKYQTIKELSQYIRSWR